MAPRIISAPTIIPVPGNKQIEEYFGCLASGDGQVSIARMKSPAGWSEPGQTPEFDEYTIVLEGWMQVEVQGGAPLRVDAGQAIHTPPGDWVRYSTPEGATYIAVCIPAFRPDTVHRDQ